MIVFPNCKINLGLNVVAKRSDGYHDLETVFYPLPLSDILEIVPASDDSVSFQSTGLPIPGDPGENLCMKAFRLMENEFHIQPVKIHLHKIIPMGAGLGGGSSDGTFTLKLLNDLFSLGLDDERLYDFARQMGSDCSFFITNRPVFASGTGDRFLPVNIDLSGRRIVLVVPPFHVKTAAAFNGITPAVPARSVRNISEVPVEEWRDFLVNDFEKSVFKQFPGIGEIKKRLYDFGAVYASMTGSGSAVFGLFSADSKISGEYPGCAMWQIPGSRLQVPMSIPPTATA